jgi:hypothetical protein
VPEEPKDPLEKLKDDNILPEPGSAGERRLKVELELVKYLGAIAFPVAGAAAVATHEVLKLFKDFRRDEKDERIATFLAALAQIVRNHEKRLGKLEPPSPPAAAKDPFAAVFLHNLEAAYNDDEVEKARFYAAFAVGIHEKEQAIPRAMKVFLFDALKKLRAHDLLLLMAMVERTNRLAGKSFDGRSRYSNIQSRELFEEAEKSGLGLERDLINHSQNALEGAGLVRVTRGVVGGGVPGQPQEGVAVSLLDLGDLLMSLIYPYLR